MTGTLRRPELTFLTELAGRVLCPENLNAVYLASETTEHDIRADRSGEEVGNFTGSGGISLLHPLVLMSMANSRQIPTETHSNLTLLEWRLVWKVV